MRARTRFAPESRNLRFLTPNVRNQRGIYLLVDFFSGLTATIQSSRVSFESDAHEITVQSFIPREGDNHPAVIVLHGSGGIRDGWAEQPASLLASRGFAVFVVHYFERTGTFWADEATIRKHFRTWMKSISDAITWATSRPQVASGCVGLLGFSLGGYLALSVATEDPRVKAVVEYFGGLPEELSNGARNLPPVLILHGDADRTVPVAQARNIERYLRDHNIEHEVKIYRGAGHGFSGFDLLDSGQRTLQWLGKHLLSACVGQK